MILFKTKPKSITFLQLTNFHTSLQTTRPATNPIQTSKLLNSYFKLGRIKDAEKLFEEIPEKNIVTWSIMIYGYATNGLYRESIKSFSKLQGSRTPPNSFSMVAVLVTSVGLHHILLGQSIHGLVMKSGFQSNTIVETAILNMYAKCGSVMDSFKIFEQMSCPSLVTCNAMITGFVDSKLFREAWVLFNQLRYSEFVPNSVTLLSIIRGCAGLESSRVCQSIHGLVVKTGLSFDISVMNAILDMYSSLEDLDAAIEIFEDITYKDIISWTTMIGLLIRLGYVSDALNLFCRMKENEVSLDPMLIMNLLMCSALLGDLKMGRSVHAQVIISGFGSQIPVANSAIAMYSKCGDLPSSRTVFDGMTGKSLVSWTSMISGYVQNGKPVEAQKLLIRMRGEEELKLDGVILVSLVTSCGELAGLEPCKQLHCHIYKVGVSQYRSVQNSLVSAYSRCGNMELARQLFDEIECRDRVSWNAIIYGYGINGCGGASVELFREMKNSGEDPDEVTYLSVLGACSHSGLVNDGLVIFKEMVEEKKVKPSEEHWGSVVDMLARAGRLSDAGILMDTLTESVGPNAWRALLNGCRIHNNVELAELAADRLLQLKREESGQTVLMSNVYASIGRFDKAEDLRSSMRDKGLVKCPGISLLDGMPWDSVQ